MTQHTHTNQLVSESSPYLLQHAHNPVNWHPWNDEALEKAKKENKLILVSIGYSSCHWCHVMERESFENEKTAELMNENFICIKVDREERPDIDQVYMLAVQLMTGQGGWPLNCFTLPDGKPIYGGTYFRNQDWKSVLTQLSNFYRQNPEKAVEYANELTLGLKSTELVKLNTDPISFQPDIADEIYDHWQPYFDKKEGGANKAPKFPLPNNYDFLLSYLFHTKNENLSDHIKLTLEKMAFGGIYDQLGGGFSRYSTDNLWKVPHFEKMLYDNAQLVSLYADAYKFFKNDLYKEVIEGTLEFIEREMTSEEGGFYSALDADSEGEEGKFYVWKMTELKEALGEYFTLFSDYYNVNDTGFWEHDNYILLRKKTDEEIAKDHQLSVEEVKNRISQAKKILMHLRDQRVRPGLDDKQLTSWNALMIKGYVDAYKALEKPEYLIAAQKAASHLLSKCKTPDGGLFRNYKNGKASINGYLEDYSFTIEALIALYQADLNSNWLETANQLIEFTIQHFYDKESGMFFFTSDLDKELIARKMEINDNVIPSSNSSLAKSLLMLSHYLEKPDYAQKSQRMLHNVKKNMSGYGSAYSNWGLLLLNLAYSFYEVAIVGKEADKVLSEINKTYLPNALVSASAVESKLPLLIDRFKKDKTLIYVCKDNTCKMPVESVKEAMAQFN